jgi:hypothetical protein
MVLSVLFVFGLQEQHPLLSKIIDEAVKQRVPIEHFDGRDKYY